jgi:hypothetical protein
MVHKTGSNEKNVPAKSTWGPDMFLGDSANKVGEA